MNDACTRKAAQIGFQAHCLMVKTRTPLAMLARLSGLTEGRCASIVYGTTKNVTLRDIARLEDALGFEVLTVPLRLRTDVATEPS